MDLSPTLQTLQLDCLLEILKYVPLPICMTLRSTCSQLKIAVDEHFRSGVQSLPVMLSARHSPEHIARFERYCHRLSSKKNKRTKEQKKKHTFGSGASQQTLWDRVDGFPVRESHFRSEDYLILFDLANFGEFVDFITKYLPGVTKLALLIDHDDHLANIPEVLNIYRKQLKVLLLERTLRSGIVERYKISESTFELSQEVYDSLDNLNTLEELYFFPKSLQTFRFANQPYNFLRGYQIPEAHKCFDRLACRLRVLHFCFDLSTSSFKFQTEVFDTLEELACYSPRTLQKSNASFPRLERLTCLSYSEHWLDLSNFVPNLTEIWSDFDLQISRQRMNELNNFPNLKRVRCEYLAMAFPRIPEWLIPGALYDEERHGVPVPNQTVEYIEVEYLHHLLHPNHLSEETALEELKHCLSYFRNLKKVIVRQPYMELTGEQLRSC